MLAAHCPLPTATARCCARPALCSKILLLRPSSSSILHSPFSILNSHHPPTSTPPQSTPILTTSPICHRPLPLQPGDFLSSIPPSIQTTIHLLPSTKTFGRFLSLLHPLVVTRRRTQDSTHASSAAPATGTPVLQHSSSTQIGLPLPVQNEQRPFSLLLNCVPKSNAAPPVRRLGPVPPRHQNNSVILPLCPSVRRDKSHCRQNKSTTALTLHRLFSRLSPDLSSPTCALRPLLPAIRPAFCVPSPSRLLSGITLASIRIVSHCAFRRPHRSTR